MNLDGKTHHQPAAGGMQIGIVAALPAELAPLTSNSSGAWQRAGNVSIGQLRLPDGTLCTAYAAAAGMGAAAATRAFAEIIARSESTGGLQAVVSYGWAGAISCGVKPPDVYGVSEVIDSGTGERFATAAAPGTPLRLVTLDHVARSDEKRKLAERYQAVLVDMEAATIGRLADAHGIPFFCIKGISDGYTDILPDFNRFLDSAGQLRLPPFVAHALLRPRYWKPLGRLAKNSRTSAGNLARHLPACFGEAGLLS